MAFKITCPTCNVTIIAESIEAAKVCTCDRAEITQAGDTERTFILGRVDPECPFHGGKVDWLHMETK